MEEIEVEINIDELRKDLINYFGTAMFGGFPMSMMEVSKIENATDEEIIDIAQKNNFDLEKYIIN